MTVKHSVPHGWYLPPGFLRKYPHNIEMSEGLLVALTAYLRSAATRLKGSRTVDAISATLDAAAAYWIVRAREAHDPLIQALARQTGMSVAMVQRCIEAEQTSSRMADLQGALDAELGDRHCLDGFVWQMVCHRYQRAIGPTLTFGVLPGNIPGLSHLPMMRALLVKSAFLGKAASNEPLYAAAYARSLAEMDSDIGDAIAVVYWPGGSTALEQCVIADADAVIAFGSQATVDSIAALTPRGKLFVGHGHKLGLVIADAGWSMAHRSRLRALAMDVAMYDQAACLAPQVIIGVGSRSQVRQMGQELARELQKLHVTLANSVTIESQAARRRWLDSVEFSGSDTVLAHGPWGAVVLQCGSAPLEPTCGGRAIRVVAVRDDRAALRVASQWGRWLQNAALAVPKARLRPLAESLAELGCTRITVAGAMPFPSMRWHHDGLQALASLVRFVDIEGAAEAPLVRPALL